MKKEKLVIENIPAIIWGKPSKRLYLFVHGKMSCKESAEAFAKIADRKGYQVLSFDLPDHGERKNRGESCDIQHGIHDLKVVAEYVTGKWDELFLYGCSIGAYFSLQTYVDLPLKKCLFQSPILDMEALINNMFLWFHITPDELKEKRFIETPVDTMSWDYYCYVKEHPIKKWTPSTSILYGSLDNLQTIDSIKAFAKAHSCEVSVSEGSEHAFMSESDYEVVEEWIEEHIDLVC